MNKEQRKIVGLLLFTATASYICRVNVSTAAPLIMKEFGLNQIQMGKIFSAFLLGYALCQIPGGILADLWGPKRVLWIATWLWFLISIIQTWVGWGLLEVTTTTALITFILFRFMLGVSEAPTYPGAAKGVSNWIFPNLQGRANGLVMASVGAGSALAPLIVSYTMVSWGWRPALIISALPALLVAILWTKIRIPTATRSLEKSEEISSNQNFSWLNKTFILITISYTLQGYVGYIFVSWFYVYLVQERHFDLLTGAWMSSLPWILSLLSIPLGGWLMDHLVKTRIGINWGRRLIPMLGMAGSGLFIAWGAHTQNAIIAAIALSVATMLILSVESPFWTTMAQLSGQHSGKAGGIMNMGSNLGGLISPTLTPWLASLIGWENALHVAAVLSIIGALIWLGIKIEQKN